MLFDQGSLSYFGSLFRRCPAFPLRHLSAPLSLYLFFFYLTRTCLLSFVLRLSFSFSFFFFSHRLAWK